MWGSRCWWESFFTLNIVAVSPCLQASHKHIFNYCNKKNATGVCCVIALSKKRQIILIKNNELTSLLSHFFQLPVFSLFLHPPPSHLYLSPSFTIHLACPFLQLFLSCFFSLSPEIPLTPSLSLSPPSHVFSLSLIGGSLVLIVFSRGKSHRRVVQSCNPPMTLPLFPITALQDSLCTESTHSQYTTTQPCSTTKTQITHAHTLYQRLISQQHVCVCNRAKQREHIYLFVFIPCWLWATL